MTDPILKLCDELEVNLKSPSPGIDRYVPDIGIKVQPLIDAARESVKKDERIKELEEESVMGYEPFDNKTANTTDRIAFALSEIIDDSAPLNWTRYRFAASCIAGNPEIMRDLKELEQELKERGG